MMSPPQTLKVRDLLPVKAVQCHLFGGLVPFERACLGEGTRSGKPCSFYVSTYMCSYLRNIGIGVDHREIPR